MGDRYILTITCERCGRRDKNVYFAPTCGISDWTCPTCGRVVDLEAHTGITYADASNADEMRVAIVCAAAPDRPNREH